MREEVEKGDEKRKSVSKLANGFFSIWPVSAVLTSLRVLLLQLCNFERVKDDAISTSRHSNRAAERSKTSHGGDD